MITNHAHSITAFPEGRKVDERLHFQGEASVKASSTDRFRRLQACELVTRGDLVRGEHLKLNRGRARPDSAPMRS